MVDIALRKKAHELVQKGKLDNALRVFEVILKEDPEDASIFNSIGDVLLKLKRREEALENFARASQLYLKDGLHMVALSVCRKALRADPEYALAHYLMGVCFEEQSKPDQARREYILYLRSKPEKGAEYVLNSLLSLTKLDPEDRSWVVRLARTAFVQRKEGILDRCVSMAAERGFPEHKKLVQMLDELRALLRAGQAAGAGTPVVPAVEAPAVPSGLRTEDGEAAEGIGTQLEEPAREEAADQAEAAVEQEDSAELVVPPDLGSFEAVLMDQDGEEPVETVSGSIAAEEEEPAVSEEEYPGPAEPAVSEEEEYPGSAEPAVSEEEYPGSAEPAVSEEEEYPGPAEPAVSEEEEYPGPAEPAVSEEEEYPGPAEPAASEEELSAPAVSPLPVDGEARLEEEPVAQAPASVEAGNELAPRAQVRPEPVRRVVRKVKKRRPEPAESAGPQTAQPRLAEPSAPSIALEQAGFESADFVEEEAGAEEEDFRPRKRLGEYFVADGLLKASDVLRALEVQASSKEYRRLGDVLVEMSLVSVRQVREALSRQVADMRRRLERSPADALGWVELGNLLLDVSDFYGAVEAYLKAAEIYRATGREKMVFELLEGVLDICPESLAAARELVRIRSSLGPQGQARSLYRLAVAYLLNDSPHEAVAALEASVQADPSFGMAASLLEGVRPGIAADLENYADIASILADIDKMFDQDSARALAGLVKEFQEGVRDAVSPDDHQTHYDLGIAYREMGLLREAIAEFNQVLQSPEHRLRAREMLGRCFHDMGRYDEAEEQFQKGLSIAGKDGTSLVGFHLNLARVYEATGRKRQAEAERKAAARIDPVLATIQDHLE